MPMIQKFMDSIADRLDRSSKARPESLSALGRLASAAPDALICLLFLLTWFFPRWLGVDHYIYMGVAFLLEFLLIHSLAFFAVASQPIRKKKAYLFLLFVGFYLIFAFGISAEMHSLWSFPVFVLLMANRMYFALFSPVPAESKVKSFVTAWVIGTALYILSFLVAVVIPFPKIGFTGDLAKAAPQDGDVPYYKLIAAGVIYFGAMAVVQVLRIPMVTVTSRTGSESKRST
jgi:hypothetical protein